MLDSSFRLGSVLGIRIGVHYTWFIIFALLTYSLYAVFAYQHEQWQSSVALGTAVVTSLLFFASILLHELGHSVVALYRGIRVRAITLFIFGGMAQTEKDAESAATEFWIAIAGPIVSLLLAGMFYVLALLTGQPGAPATEACTWLARINLMVALFNLLPGFPLDGGRVFRAIVWWVSGNARKGMQWALWSGRVVAYGLIGYGLFVILYHGYVINGMWIALIGWFLLNLTQAHGREYTLGRVLNNVTVLHMMRRDVPRVAATTPILEWVDDYVLTHGLRAYLVDDEGRAVGLVTLSDASRIERAEWGKVSVRKVMTPYERLHMVSPDANLAQVMRLMYEYSLNQVPVNRNGDIVGWIDRDYLLRVLQLHSETGR
ncbi:MAG: site-2 protease family protein [Pseudomonadota bacterium]|nr:MAG: site-2 protease family protein [Pseudomonadota bacterium]